MTKTEFQMGLKIFLSCGGPNPDKETLEVWYRLLSNIHPEDFEKAVIDLVEQVKALGPINFVAEVRDRSRLHRDQRESILARNQRALPPADMIPPEKLRGLCKDLIATLKDVPKI